MKKKKLLSSSSIDVKNEFLENPKITSEKFSASPPLFGGIIKENIEIVNLLL